MTNVPDAYTTLGLLPGAPWDQVLDRYRWMATANHPDRFSGEHNKARAEAEMKRINAARDLLKAHLKIASAAGKNANRPAEPAQSPNSSQNPKASSTAKSGATKDSATSSTAKPGANKDSATSSTAKPGASASSASSSTAKPGASASSASSSTAKSGASASSASSSTARQSSANTHDSTRTAQFDPKEPSHSKAAPATNNSTFWMWVFAAIFLFAAFSSEHANQYHPLSAAAPPNSVSLAPLI